MMAAGTKGRVEIKDTTGILGRYHSQESCGHQSTQCPLFLGRERPALGWCDWGSSSPMGGHQGPQWACPGCPKLPWTPDKCLRLHEMKSRVRTSPMPVLQKSASAWLFLGKWGRMCLYIHNPTGLSKHYPRF